MLRGTINGVRPTSGTKDSRGGCHYTTHRYNKVVYSVEFFVRIIIVFGIDNNIHYDRAIAQCKLLRTETFHGHNYPMLRRPDPLPFQRGCGYARPLNGGNVIAL